MTTVYDELEQAWKRELNNSELQPMRQGLLNDLKSYIRRLREAERNIDAKSLKSNIIEEELSRIQQLLTQLLDRRAEKLTSGSDPAQLRNLDNSERLLNQSVSRLFLDYEQMKQDIFQGRDPSTPNHDDKELVMVRFSRDVPSIIGVDLKAHGPFRREDVANLPSENAESLVRQGAAAKVSVSHQDNG